jgi:hypothetical protein
MEIMETILKWLSRNRRRAIILLLLFGLSCMFYYGLGDKPLGASMMACIGFLLLMVEQENKHEK